MLIIVTDLFFSVLLIGPNPAQISILFHKNLPPRDFSIMTLIGSEVKKDKLKAKAHKNSVNVYLGAKTPDF